MFGLTMIDAIALAAGMNVLIVLYGVYRAALVRDPMRGRVKVLEGRRDALRAGLMTAKQRQSPIKKADSAAAMRSLADRFKLLQAEETKKIGTKLAQAGFRGTDAVAYYQVARLTMPLVMGLAAIILFYGLGAMPSMKSFHPILAVGMVLFGLKGPDIYVANTKAKRTDAIRKSLPDALDLMVVCAEAGLTLDAALNRVSKELEKSSPELADEFQLAAIELSFLPERRDALTNLSDRVDLPMLRGVVTTLIQSEKYGTPLASSLRVLSSEFRNERLMKAEEKAAKLPATLTVPLILFILPVLFVVLLGPAACKVTDDFINSGPAA